MIYCVDLDGTLVQNDMSVTSFWYCLKRNPLIVFNCIFWYLKGKRSYIKHNLAPRFKFDVASLKYNEQLISWLEELKKDESNEIYLVSGSTQSVVDKIASNFSFFAKGYGSTLEINLTGNNKLEFIKKTFNDVNNICYVGNSRVDFHVWAGVGYAAVVSDNENFNNKAHDTAKVLKVFRGSWK